MSKTRANNEGNIKLRADGRYEVRVTVDYDKMTGKPKRVSKYAKTREEAVKLLNQMSFMNDTSPNNFTRVTLGDWLDLCLEVYMKNTIKQSTYLSYESYIRVHLKPVLGDVVLQELTPRMLQLFYNYKAESEGLSAKTIVNLNLFLHRALKFAVAEGYINPHYCTVFSLDHSPTRILMVSLLVSFQPSFPGRPMLAKVSFRVSPTRPTSGWKSKF